MHKKYIVGAHRAPLQLRTPSCRGGLLIEAARCRACASRTAGDLANCCIVGGHRRCEQIGIEHIPLLASPQGGVAERVTKYREASADREAGVVFRSKTKRKTTPAAAALLEAARYRAGASRVASQYLIDDAATPFLRLRAAALALRGGDARREMALDCNSFTAVTKISL